MIQSRNQVGHAEISIQLNRGQEAAVSFIIIGQNGFDMSSAYIFLLLALWRCFTSLFLVTYFNPDEPWQSLEPAASLAFGPDQGYLTWEFAQFARIRSIIHPAIFASLYKVLQYLQLDSNWAVIYAPRLFQAILAAVADYFYYRFLLRYSQNNEKFTKYVFFLHATNWFFNYTIVRTYSNSMETIICLIAFYYWPWNNSIKQSYNSNRYKAFILASLAIIIRPTNAILWLILGLYHSAFTLQNSKQRIKLFIAEILPIGAISLLFSIAVDSLYYGEFTFVIWNFFKFNFLYNVSELYGVHSFHWYLTQGLPSILGTSTLLLIFALYYNGSAMWQLHRELILASLGTILLYSLNAHKEFRFILVTLPLLHIIPGQFLYQLALRAESPTASFQTAPNPRRFSISMRKFRCLLAGIVVLNALALIFLGQFHQAAPISSVRYLAAYIPVHYAGARAVSVHFLMGCHSTPHYSYFHAVKPPVKLVFLDCSPLFVHRKGEIQLFEKGFNPCSASNQFRSDTGLFLQRFYGENNQSLTDCSDSRLEHGAERIGPNEVEKQLELPEFVVTFDNDYGRLEEFLREKGYTELERFWHSLGEEKFILVFERSKSI
jgi:phosphatidylinositol glycan class B